MNQSTNPQKPEKAKKTGAANGKKRKKKASTGRVIWQMFLNVLKAIFVFGCIGLVIVSVLAVYVVNYMVGATANDDALLDLENISLSQTSYIYAWSEAEQEWVEYQELISASEHRIWADLNQIPQDLINAVVATEDRDFYNHHGVSFSRTAYALMNEVFEMRTTFGASTIDQQLVKNLTGDRDVYDDDGDRSAGYLRKLREIFRAWGLNNNYSKDMIMEVYLNTMGLSEKLVGVQAGALTYFNKDVSELTLWECATIAGITQAPTYYSPVQNPDNALVRRDNVLTFMWECDFITYEEYRHALAQPLGLDLTELESQSDSVYSYFTDKVFYDLVDELMAEKGYTYSEAVNYIYTGGLRIYATIDLELQALYEDIFYHGYDEEGYFTQLTNGPGGRSYKDVVTLDVNMRDEEGNITGTYEMLPQLAIASVRYDGSLAAVVGGVGEKDSSLSLNRATQSPRQVGSTMKPIAAYALGIDLGLFNWSSMLADAPSQYSNPTSTARHEDGTPRYDWPKNATMRYRNSNVPVVTAVAESLNTVAVRVGVTVGVEDMFYFLRDTLQISSLVAPGELLNEDGTPSGNSDMAISPLALGALTYGITAYELAGAYTMFGGDSQYGQFNSLHSYTQVLDSRGNIILKPTITRVQAISEQTGFIMNRLLWNVLNGSNLPAGGAATARGKSPEGEMDAVAKTGTTNDDRDRWFVGLTPYWSTAIWWGYDVNTDDIASSYNRGISSWNRVSYNVPNNLWKMLMEAAQENREYREFPPQPQGVVTMSYCAVTGLPAGAHCGQRYTGYFEEGDPLMDTVCPGHAGIVGLEEEEPVG